MAPPFGGAIQTVQAYTIGYNFDISLIPIDYFRPLQSSSPSGLWTLSQPAVFGSEPLVMTPSKNYTAKDWKSLISDLGLDLLTTNHDRIQNPRLDQLVHPLVETDVFFGSQIQTPSALVFDQDLHPNQKLAPASKSFEEGDGTVPVRSALWAKKWKRTDNSSEEVVFHEIPGAGHVSMLTQVPALQQVVNLIAASNSLPLVDLYKIEAAIRIRSLK